MEEKPNFFKLQKHGERWERLIESSKTYGEKLRRMKDSYDKYLNALLDQQLAREKLEIDPKELSYLVSFDVNNSKKHGDAENDVVKEKRRAISELKEKISKSLDRKERLRRIFNEHKMHCNDVADDSDDEEEIDIIDKNRIEVETLQTKIELKFHDLNSLKRYRKNHFVPIAVYQRLEDCIKETEVDVQKLCKQNEYLESNVDELEDELDKILVKTGAKNRDGGKLWRKVEAVKVADMGDY